MNTLHTWTKLDGMKLWRELVKRAENTLEQLVCVFSVTRDQLPPICFDIF